MDVILQTCCNVQKCVTLISLKETSSCDGRITCGCTCTADYHNLQPDQTPELLSIKEMLATLVAAGPGGGRQGKGGEEQAVVQGPPNAGDSAGGKGDSKAPRDGGGNGGKNDSLDEDPLKMLAMWLMVAVVVPFILAIMGAGLIFWEWVGRAVGLLKY